MRIVIEKGARELTLWDGARQMFRCRIALGREPAGPKEREGDGRTPEGVYTVCLVKERGKYGRSLGLSYPGMHDAQAALARGEIYLHEGGNRSDWTQGCVALEEADMDRVFPLRDRVEAVEIRP